MSTPTSLDHDLLVYLRQRGQRLDTEMAKDLGLPLALVQEQLHELAAKQQIVLCKTTRFVAGKPVDGWYCRLSGYSPAAAPGRKAKDA